MLGLLLIAQSVMVPAASPPESRLSAPATDALTLVIADAIEQTDPRPLCGEPNCTFMFLGRFDNARVLAGPELSRSFSARLEMGSPFTSRYRLALIVERRPGGEAVVRAARGFNGRTRSACFEPADIDRLGWAPSGPGITMERGALCVTE